MAEKREVMKETLDFYSLEKPLVAIKEQIDALEVSDDSNRKEKIAALRDRLEKEWEKIVPKLTAVHIVQIARHPRRPYTLD